jgi:hypothetical protein
VLRSSWHASSNCTSSRSCWKVVPAAARRRVCQPASREGDRGALLVEPGREAEDLPEGRQRPWGGERELDILRLPLRAAERAQDVEADSDGRRGERPRHGWGSTGTTQFLVANPLDRYLINSPMLGDMKFGADGSLTIYVQKDSPGKDKESNWLPAPNGPIFMVMRLYWPKTEPPSILPPGKGTWSPPKVVVAQQ